MIRKITRSAVLVFAITALLLIVASAAQSARVSANGGLRLRASASTSAKVLVMIPNGATVSVAEKGSSWSKVSYSGKTGYVATKYLVFGGSTTSRSNTPRDVAAQKRQNVVNTAKGLLGTPYVSGGASPSGFDCSGFTQYVYKQNGYQIARGPSSQINSLSVKVAKSDLLPGDLVFFKDSRYGSGTATHVGVYVGNGQMIHSPNRGQVVKYASINSGYYGTYYIGARRIIQ